MHEQPLCTLLNLRGNSTDMGFVDAVRSVAGVAPPTEPNTFAEADEFRLLWLAPDEWLLIAPAGSERMLVDALYRALGEQFAAVTGVSSGFARLGIAGAQSRDLLARGCTVDLHPRAFGIGRCVQTLLAKADVIIVQVDNAPAFHVIVQRSLAGYLWMWLTDAALEARAVARLSL